MSAAPTMTLSEVLNQIKTTPDFGAAEGKLLSVEQAIVFSESQLKNLQELKQCLEHTQVVSKADALKVSTGVKRIYGAFGIEQEIATYWQDTVRPNLNNEKYTFVGADMAKNLLLNKSINVLNRNIFAAKRSVETVRVNGKQSLYQK
jgi:hypothetical protein